MESKTKRILHESNQIGIQFLRTDLQAGHTLMDIADVTNVETSRKRTVYNARRAYDFVLWLMVRLDLSRFRRLSDRLGAAFQGANSAHPAWTNPGNSPESS